MTGFLGYILAFPIEFDANDTASVICIMKGKCADILNIQHLGCKRDGQRSRI